jgi:RimJ/RimL family protein N-acetyltransferase
MRLWQDSDLNAMHAINSDPKVMEFLLPRTREETARFIQACNDNYAKYGYCLYAATLKTDGTLIGWVGLQYTDLPLPFCPSIELGWRLGSQYWGQGYAFEAASAIRDMAFTQLNISDLISLTVPANVRSIRLMQRLGFTRDLDGDFLHPRVPDGHALRKNILHRLRRL